MTTRRKYGASRGACLACEAVVSKGTFRKQIQLGQSSMSRPQPDPHQSAARWWTCSTISPVYHGLASEARSTAYALLTCARRPPYVAPTELAAIWMALAI